MDGSFLLMGVIGVVIYFSVKKASAIENKKTKSKDGNNMAEVIVLQCGNVPQGVRAKIECIKDGLEITSSGYSKIIPYENIVDLSLESASQMANNTDFSFGKAVAGTALLGSMGVVGGFAGKNYTPKTLVLSFIDDGETIYMVFIQQTSTELGFKKEGLLLEKSYELIRKTINDKKHVRLHS